MEPLPKSELRYQLRQACALAGHTVGNWSLKMMIQLVLEEGLPARKERERLLALRLQEDDTTGD